MARIRSLSDLGTSSLDDSAFGSSPFSAGASTDAFAAAAKAVAVKAPAPPSQVLYLKEAGDAATISLNDIHQGQLGDCFLLSSIGELAMTNASAISNMIHSNANGTETVTLYVASNGRLPSYTTGAFKAVTVVVANTFPTDSVNNGATQDVVAGQKEIWPEVLEKAVATLDGGYAAIANGGSPMVAMEELTGRATSYMSPSSLTAAKLQAFVAAGDLIVMDTYSRSNLSNNLVSNHAYMFEKLTMTTAGAMVQLGNPWGYNQPSPIPLAQLSRSITEVDVGSSRHA